MKDKKYEVWEYDTTVENWFQIPGVVIGEDLTYKQAETLIKIVPEHLVRIMAEI